MKKTAEKVQEKNQELGIWYMTLHYNNKQINNDNNLGGAGIIKFFNFLQDNKPVYFCQTNCISSMFVYLKIILPIC